MEKKTSQVAEVIKFSLLRSEDKINTETGRRIFIHFQGMKTGA
ncbi:Uncharacterised protein [Candidatus Venteria ishoeyi]|uniref:Uncharacterized protein n=1 Tax=Candidatus Venteria ishoeyi TaxID=1899563 RepID=A0A1H6F905_9GAMM|nr:Uncharacterised protein [Candidatus Venteria ishoeyi]